MQIRPSPLTAALTGAFAAVAWPFLVDRFGSVGSGASLELVLATIFVIALPACSFLGAYRRGGFPPEPLMPVLSHVSNSMIFR